MIGKRNEVSLTIISTNAFASKWIAGTQPPRLSCPHNFANNGSLYYLKWCFVYFV